MPVDARRRYELYAAFEPLLGDTTAAFMEMLREIAEEPELQRWNYERFRREPGRTYALYIALRRSVEAGGAQTVMEILDPIGAAEVWPIREPSDSGSVAGTTNGDDHGAG